MHASLASIAVAIIVFTGASADVQGTQSTFQYLTFQRKLNAADIQIINTATQNTDAVQCDDTPLTPVELPFRFMYFGRTYESLYLNPNGAIHMDPVPPCGCCFAGDAIPGKTCTLSTSWHASMMVATDLNPQGAASAFVGVSGDSNSTFVVHYSRIPAYMTTPLELGHFRYSFAFILRSNGHIQVALENVMDPMDMKDPPAAVAQYGAELGPPWLIGIKPPQGVAEHFPEAVRAAQAASMKAWNVETFGYFPAGRDNVSSGTILEYCPAPSKLCAVPTRAAPGSMLRLEGNAPFQCGDGVLTYHCLWSNSSWSATTMGILSATAQHINCSVPAYAQLGLHYKLSLTYSPVQQPSTVMRVPMQDMFFEVDTDAAASDQIPNVSPKPKSNQASSMTTNQTLNMTTNQTSNMTNQISSETSSEINDCKSATRCSSQAYSWIDCAGLCNGHHIQGVTPGSCCTIDDIDCSGKCYGDAQVGWHNNFISGRTCCLNATGGAAYIDCAGVCIGQARLDACGVCAGGSTGLLPSQPPCTESSSMVLDLTPTCDFRGIEIKKGSCACLQGFEGSRCQKRQEKVGYRWALGQWSTSPYRSSVCASPPEQTRELLCQHFVIDELDGHTSRTFATDTQCDAVTVPFLTASSLRRPASTACCSSRVLIELRFRIEVQVSVNHQRTFKGLHSALLASPELQNLFERDLEDEITSILAPRDWEVNFVSLREASNNGITVELLATTHPDAADLYWVQNRLLNPLFIQDVAATKVRWIRGLSGLTITQLATAKCSFSAAGDVRNSIILMVGLPTALAMLALGLYRFYHRRRLDRAARAFAEAGFEPDAEVAEDVGVEHVELVEMDGAQVQQEDHRERDSVQPEQDEQAET